MYWTAKGIEIILLCREATVRKHFGCWRPGMPCICPFQSANVDFPGLVCVKNSCASLTTSSLWDHSCDTSRKRHTCSAKLSKPTMPKTFQERSLHLQQCRIIFFAFKLWAGVSSWMYSIFQTFWLGDRQISWKTEPNICLSVVCNNRTWYSSFDTHAPPVRQTIEQSCTPKKYNPQRTCPDISTLKVELSHLEQRNPPCLRPKMHDDRSWQQSAGN